ncbi:MAG: LolA family protein [Cyclobacteriaceae bacterium]
MKQFSLKGWSIALAFFMLLTQHAWAQYDPKAKEILDEMSNTYQEIGAFKSDFSYSMENPTQSISEDFEGEITVNGDKYRLNMGGQEIINNGETVWTYLEEVNEVNIDNYDPSEGDISPTQIYNAYKRGFKYVYLEDQTENGSTYHLVDLLPENNDNQFFKIRLFISKDDKTLKRWKVFDKNGTIYTYEISNFNPDAEISDDVFTFDESNYQGVEVVDLR